jgi:hypothetical protein
VNWFTQLHASIQVLMIVGVVGIIAYALHKFRKIKVGPVEADCEDTPEEPKK